MAYQHLREISSTQRQHCKRNKKKPIFSQDCSCVVAALIGINELSEKIVSALLDDTSAIAPLLFDDVDKSRVPLETTQEGL